MSKEFIDCLLAALSEAIGITAIYGIIDLIISYGFNYFAKEAGKLALKQLLKATLKRLVPAGILILIAEILWHIYWCS
ncbi:MAG TPA: hypothetical protein VFW07_16905 [Parafilimonas sp.]|nr:hypothetical protein [Parafilimonas sp.]